MSYFHFIFVVPAIILVIQLFMFNLIELRNAEVAYVCSIRPSFECGLLNLTFC